MKKLLVAVLSLIFVFSCISLTAFAEESIFQKVPEEGKDYFVMDESRTVLKTLDFESGMPTMATQWGSREVVSEGAIAGNGSLSLSSGEAGYPQLNTGILAGNKQTGRFFVEFDFKPVAGAYGMAVPVMGGYNATCIAELGIVFTWEGETLTNVEIGAVGGYKDGGYENAVITANDNGSYHAYFEYVVDSSNVGSLTDGNDPHIWFNMRATDAAADSVLVDNIVYGQIANVQYVKNPLKTLDFESGMPTMATAWGSREVVSEGAIAGNGSLSLSSGEAGYPQLNTGLLAGNNQTGRYFVEFDFKPVASAYGMAVPVCGGYNATCIAELGIVFTWEGETLTNVEIGAVGGFKDGGHENAVITANDNGSYHAYFEYVVDSSNVGSLTDGNDPHIWFNMRATDAAADSVLVDNIVYGKMEEVAAVKYYTVDWDEDYNSYEVGADAYGSQPVWGNDAQIVDDWFETKSLALRGATATYTWGDTIGGFESRGDADHIASKFLKGTGKSYISVDIGQDNCTMINIWTTGYYTSVQFNGSTWFSEGNVVNLQATQIEGGHRLTWCIDLPADQFELEFKINAAGENGIVYIDNLKVVREDVSPFVSNGEYNRIDTQDVVLDVDLKGQSFVSLASGGAPVDQSNYTLQDGTLTLDKSLFVGEESYTFVLTSDGGSRQFVVSQKDNRIVVTPTSAAISKEYDGTADIEGAVMELQGVTEGHKVTLTWQTAQLDKEDVTATKAIFSGLALEGEDAYRYVLQQDVLEVDATVTPKQITASVISIQDTKVYDGTDNVSSIRASYDPMQNATLVVTAKYNTADVSADTITVTYQLQGDGAANYIAPQSQTMAGSITPKPITVVADAKTKVEGESDPQLTYKATGLVGSDTLTGSLQRAAGEEAGDYDITIGTLANANYTISFTGAKLTITAAKSGGWIVWLAVGLVAVAAGATAIVLVRKKRK